MNCQNKTFTERNSNIQCYRGNREQAPRGVTNEPDDPMSTHEQPSVDLARLVRAADLLRWLTGPTVSCLDGRVRATATDRTCPGARFPSRTEVASADGQNRHPTEAPRSRRRLPAEARRRSGPRRERLVTASPPALPLREHLRSQTVPVHAPIVRSDPSGTDKTATACPPGTNPVPTDHTQIEQAND